MTRLYHLTTTTGHARWSERSEISPEAMRVVGDLLQALALEPNGTRRPMPRPPGYDIVASFMESALTAQVFRSGAADPLVTIECFSGEGHDFPRVEATVEPALLLDFEAGSWLGDFERCLGWAFYDRRRAGRV